MGCLVSGCVVKVDSRYFVEYICLLFNKSFPFLEIAIYEYIPIVSELLRLAQSGYEQRVQTLLGRVRCISYSAVLEVFAVVGKQSVCLVFLFSLCNNLLRGSLVASLLPGVEICNDLCFLVHFFPFCLTFALCPIILKI